MPCKNQDTILSQCSYIQFKLPRCFGKEIFHKISSLPQFFEDTDVTIEEIKRKFGQQVAQYVDVLTISSVQDFKQSFIHTTKLGSDVLSIRAADLIQNSYYYHLAPVDAQKQLRDKYEFFMKLSNRVLNESLSNELRKAYEKNVKILQRHSQRIKIQTSNQETSP